MYDYEHTKELVRKQEELIKIISQISNDKMMENDNAVQTNAVKFIEKFNDFLNYKGE